MVHQKLQKMLEMLIMLGSKYGRTKTGLASHFDIHEKTVSRYFTSFKDAGFILEQNDKCWKINKEDSQYKDLSQLLHFSQEESLVLRNAINSINAPDAIIEELTHKLYSIYNFDRVATPLIETNKEIQINAIEGAIKSKKQIILCNYSSSNTGVQTDRYVEAFDFTHNYRAVWAYEIKSKLCKMFVLSRINDVEITERKWKYERKHIKTIPDIFRMTGDKLTTIKLKLNIRAKNLLIEEYPLSEKYLASLPNNTFILKTDVYSLEGVGRFIKGLLNEIEIIEPIELKLKIESDIKKYLKS